MRGCCSPDRNFGEKRRASLTECSAKIGFKRMTVPSPSSITALTGCTWVRPVMMEWHLRLQSGFLSTESRQTFHDCWDSLYHTCHQKEGILYWLRLNSIGAWVGHSGAFPPHGLEILQANIKQWLCGCDLFILIQPISAIARCCGFDMTVWLKLSYPT